MPHGGGGVGSCPVHLWASSLATALSGLGRGFQAGIARGLRWGCCHCQACVQELAEKWVKLLFFSLTHSSLAHQHFHKSTFHSGKLRERKTRIDVFKDTTLQEGSKINTSLQPCPSSTSQPSTLRCIHSDCLPSSAESP